MRLTVRFRHSTDCNVSLPRQAANTIVLSRCKARSVGLVLAWSDPKTRAARQALVGWSGSCSATKDDMEISPHLAASLGLTEGLSINVDPAEAVATATTVLVEPATEDDWEVIELHAGFLEEKLLSQVQFVFEGETVPLWVAGDTVAFVRVTKVAGADVATKSGLGFVRIAQDGQVIVAPKPRPIAKVQTGETTQRRLWLRVAASLNDALPTLKSASAPKVELPASVPSGHACLVNPLDVPVAALYCARTRTRGVGAGSSAHAVDRRAAVKVVPSEDVARGTVVFGAEAAAALECRPHSLVFFESFLVLPQPTRADKVVLQELVAPSTRVTQSKPSDAATVSTFKSWFARHIGEAKEPVVVYPAFVAQFSDGRTFEVFVNCDASTSYPETAIALHPSSIHSSTQFAVTQGPRETVPFRDALHPDLEKAYLEDELGGYEQEFRVASQYVDACTEPSLTDLRSSIGTPGLPGILIVGTWGIGRTSFALTLAGRASRSQSSMAYIVHLSCTRIASATAVRGRGETPSETISRLLWECIRNAPSVLILDDLDAIVPGSSQQQQQPEDERSVVDVQTAQALRELFDCAKDIYGRCGVAIVATAQSLASIHPSLQGTSAFGKVVELLPPSKAARAEIIVKAARKRGASVDPSADLISASLNTEGFIAADLVQVVERAMLESISRADSSPVQASATVITQSDISTALDGFAPLSLMGVKALAASDVTWDDVGGLVDVKRSLKETLEWPAKFPGLFENIPIRLRSGVLLFGPPGCGKTLLAQAVARECSLNFISVKGPELLSKYIGQSELAVRDLFRRAQAAKPSVLFFDEFDSLAPRRGHDTTGVTDRVVNQLLTQLDGVEALTGVYVLAASSRPDLIDPALLRPGRIDVSLYCGFPTSAEDLEGVLRALTRNMALDDGVNLGRVSAWCNGKNYSPADLRAALYSAQLDTVKAAIAKAESAPPTTEHAGPEPRGLTAAVREEAIMEALGSTRPSVSPHERRHYELIYAEFMQSRTGVSPDAQTKRFHKPKQTLA